MVTLLQQAIVLLRDAKEQLATAPARAEMAEADEQFHLLLAQSAKNDAITGVFQMLRPYFHTMMEQNVAVLGSDGCTAHLKIVAAIESRNSELARQQMYAHLNRTMEKTSMLNYAADLEKSALRRKDGGE